MLYVATNGGLKAGTCQCTNAAHNAHTCRGPVLTEQVDAAEITGGTVIPATADTASSTAVGVDRWACSAGVCGRLLDT